MSAVWVVRENGEVEAAFAREGDAIDYRQRYGAADMTVTRETLLTPEMAAVIAAAKAANDASATNWRHAGWTESWVKAITALCVAVTTLRAQEGE